MSSVAVLVHLLNFVAPAAFVAALLALATCPFMRKRPAALALLGHAAINFIVGVAVLAAGLVLTGHDGTMATYIALAVACGSVQWLRLRRARR